MPELPITSEKGDLHKCYYCSKVVHNACAVLDEKSDPFKVLHTCRTCSPGTSGSGSEDDSDDRKRAAVPRTPSTPPADRRRLSGPRGVGGLVHQRATFTGDIELEIEDKEGGDVLDLCQTKPVVRKNNGRFDGVEPWQHPDDVNKDTFENHEVESVLTVLVPGGISTKGVASFLLFTRAVKSSVGASTYSAG
jgi:hypothetical protein